MKSHKDEVRTANGSVLTMATVYDRGWNEGQKVLVAQSCLTLWHPMDCSLPASSVHRIFQARVLEWVAIPFSRGSSWPRDWTWVSCIASRFLTIWVHRNEGQFSSVAQSCPTLCDLMDCSTPGFHVHHQLPELAQIYMRWVGDTTQPAPPLPSPSPPTFHLSQHQGLFQWISSLHQVAKVLELQLQFQHQSFQWLFRIGFL